MSNGFFTGMVETQPYDSNSTRCKGNFTLGYDSGYRIYDYSKIIVDNYDKPTYQTNFIQDIAYVMKVPFGVPYSCYYGYEDIMVNEDPWADGRLSIEEALEERIMISNDILTNVFFNMGYMYQDVSSILDLKNTDSQYHNNLGVYSGDFFIRVFWRKRFTRNFSYIEGNPNADDPYSTPTEVVVDTVP